MVVKVPRRGGPRGPQGTLNLDYASGSVIACGILLLDLWPERSSCPKTVLGPTHPVGPAGIKGTRGQQTTSKSTRGKNYLSAQAFERIDCSRA